MPDKTSGLVVAPLPFEELTTAQVVEYVIKPATLCGAADVHVQCTFAQLLIAQARCAPVQCARGSLKPCRVFGCARRGVLTRLVAHTWRVQRASSAMLGVSCSATLWLHLKRTRTLLPVPVTRIFGLVRTAAGFLFETPLQSGARP